MPQPPQLPVIDWRALFARAPDYAAWLAASPAHGGAIDAARLALVLEPATLDALAAIAKPVHVIAIAEDWCGDVHRHVPVLQRLADCSGGRVMVRYIRRDDPSGIFVRYLTNGGEAIPRFVFLSADFVETGSWGPMPAECRAIIARGRAANDIGAARRLVAARYAADPGRAVVAAELVEQIGIAATVRLDDPAVG